MIPLPAEAIVATWHEAPGSGARRRGGGGVSEETNTTVRFDSKHERGTHRDEDFVRVVGVAIQLKVGHLGGRGAENGAAQTGLGEV